MSDPWKLDGVVWSEEMQGTGTGGDNARGIGYTARFRRDDLPGSMVTVIYYPEIVAGGQFDGCYGITGQIEYLICTDPSDPGGTEVWSDIEYDNDRPLVYQDLAAAEVDAKREINRWIAYVNDFLTWNGAPS